MLFTATRTVYDDEMKSQPLRALVGARVSIIQGPQKVSHIAQIETATKWALSQGYEIVGQFEDLGVSAEKLPEDRPELGKWLAEDGSELWDVIVWSKMDRAFRSTRHCVDFARWAEERHKIVVFAEDGLTLNYRDSDKASIESMMAELFVYIGSFFAQLELNRFKTRALDGQRVLRQTDRWASGTAPFGYQIVDHPSGQGRGLAPDPAAQVVLHEAAARLLRGEPFIQITGWLNEAYPARHWYVSTVVDILTSPRTQGLKLHKRQTVLDGDGQPIRLAEPTFDPDTWRRIQDAAKLRQLNQRTPAGSTNPMLGIGICGCTGCSACEPTLNEVTGTIICGATLAQQLDRRSGKEYRYYRCGRTPVVCKGKSTKAEVGDELLEERFLEDFGDERVTRRIFVPGEDHSHELEQTNETIARLRRESDAGLVVSPEDERVYLARMRSLIERRTKLEAQPTRSSGYVTEQTSHTYREVWPDLTPDARRGLLVDRGVKFVLHQGKPLHAGTIAP